MSIAVTFRSPRQSNFAPPALECRLTSLTRLQTPSSGLMSSKRPPYRLRRVFRVGCLCGDYPIDVAQFFWHVTVIAQKLANLYGWPDLIDPEVDLDEETELRIVLLIGAMLGAAKANRLLVEISGRFAGETARRLPRYALTKTAYYPLIKMVLKWVGIKVTKQSFARVLAGAIPVVGGVLSAGATVLVLRPMAARLKDRLRELSYARPTNA